MLSILARKRYHAEGNRVVLAVATDLEAALLAEYHAPLAAQLALQLGATAVALAAAIDPTLAPARQDAPLSPDERRRRLEAQHPHFVLFEQTFQTFLDI